MQHLTSGITPEQVKDMIIKNLKASKIVNETDNPTINVKFLPKDAENDNAYEDFKAIQLYMEW